MREQILKKREQLVKEMTDLNNQHQQVMNMLKQQETKMVQIDGAIKALDELLQEKKEEVKE
jgi:septal ring factor EnvC (AmiA/AmiB activator)